MPQAGQFAGIAKTRSLPSRRAVERADDLRDDVPGALHDDVVADPDVLAQDVVLVVQRRELDDDAADDDGLEHRERVQLAGAPDVDADVEELA